MVIVNSSLLSNNETVEEGYPLDSSDNELRGLLPCRPRTGPGQADTNEWLLKLIDGWSWSSRLPGATAGPVPPRLLGVLGDGEVDVRDQVGGQEVLLHLPAEPEAVTAVPSE